MQNTIIIAADDFGLTRGITDTILETVDAGPVTLVSVIPNGEAVAYAIEEYKKRASHLTLAMHLTLTEGKALSHARDLPLLTDAEGYFVHGVAGLWFAYLMAGNTTKEHFREQVRREITAQLTRVKELSGVADVAVNGHQHVHLVPFVCDTLLALPGVARIRTVREPLQWTWSPMTLLSGFVLRLLSERVARAAKLRGIATNDAFVGFIYSGHMTEKTLRAGLARAQGSVEVLLHPGSALPGELEAWKGSRADVRWHYSPWRARERALLGNVTL